MIKNSLLVLAFVAFASFAAYSAFVPAHAGSGYGVDEFIAHSESLASTAE